MKRILLFACLCGMVIGLASCEKKDITEEITIYGNVIDRTTGLPLYNVLIQEKNKVGGSTVTGNDGNYEFTLPLNGSSDGKYYLVTSKDKYSPSEYELEMSKVDKDRRVKVDFQLTKASITYTGTVMDAKNSPIQGVHLSATYKTPRYNSSYEAIGSTVISHADGSYTLELPIPLYDNLDGKNIYWSQWIYNITAKKEGYVNLSYYLNQSAEDTGKNITLNFVLKSNRVTIFGKVVDQNGQPIANANVYDIIFSTGTWSSEGGYYYDLKGSKRQSTTQTDVNGNYTISSIVYLRVDGYDSRRHEYGCTKEGYKTQWRYLNTADEDGGNTYNIDFTLTKQ